MSENNTAVEETKDKDTYNKIKSRTKKQQLEYYRYIVGQVSIGFHNSSTNVFQQLKHLLPHDAQGIYITFNHHRGRNIHVKTNTEPTKAFSLNTAINQQPNNKKIVITPKGTKEAKQFRNEVAMQIWDLKKKWCNNCAICEKKVPLKSLRANYFPVTFAQLKESYKSTITDHSISWPHFHEQHAQIRFVCKECHQSPIDDTADNNKHE